MLTLFGLKDWLFVANLKHFMETLPHCKVAPYNLCYFAPRNIKGAPHPLPVRPKCFNSFPYGRTPSFSVGIIIYFDQHAILQQFYIENITWVHVDVEFLDISPVDAGKIISSVQRGYFLL